MGDAIKEPTCKTCLFWRQHESHPGPYGVGTCRRFPPTLLTLKVMLKDYAKDSDCYMGMQPDTTYSHTCGEHPDFPAHIASLAKPEITRRSE